MKKRKGRRVVAALACLGILLLAGTVMFQSAVAPPKVASKPSLDGGSALELSQAGRKSNFYTFLICGTDDGNGGTDTIMVAAYDVDNQKMNVMSIPRDTMVNVSWSTKKINSTYNAGGLELLQENVAKLIGFPVDFYIRVDLKGFVKLVDAIGGVEFNVPFSMNYDDPSQDLSIHIQKGLQKLDGEHAIGVVRWRKNNNGTGYTAGDIGRIQTQQAFMTAVAKQSLTVGNLTKVNEFAKIFADYVDTNLKTGNLIWLAQKVSGMSADDMNFFTLPGNYAVNYHGASYVTPNIDELVEAINAYLNPYKRDVTADMLDIMTLSSGGKLVSSTGTLAGGSSSNSSSSSRSSDSSGEGSSSSKTKASQKTASPKRKDAKPSASQRAKQSASPSDSGSKKESQAPGASSQPETAKPSREPENSKAPETDSAASKPTEGGDASLSTDA
ncbi:MAG: LCP family protein [Oscillospiraceae bacterium]|nr:LCP family protein [Oscillospiraceae bacterium]